MAIVRIQCMLVLLGAHLDYYGFLCFVFRIRSCARSVCLSWRVEIWGITTGGVVLHCKAYTSSLGGSNGNSVCYFMNGVCVTNKRGARSTARSPPIHRAIMPIMRSPTGPSQIEYELPPQLIFLLAGQSNMAGRGPITQKHLQEVEDPHILCYLQREEVWKAARHPLHADKPEKAGVGPGDRTSDPRRLGGCSAVTNCGNIMAPRRK